MKGECMSKQVTLNIKATMNERWVNENEDKGEI